MDNKASNSSGLEGQPKKSVDISKDIENLINCTLTLIVEKSIPQLIDSLSDIIEDEIFKIVLFRINEWKDEKIETLNAATDNIKSDCLDNNLIQTLQDNMEYKKAINHWIVDVIGNNIAFELITIFNKYGLQKLTIDDLNYMMIPASKVDREATGYSKTTAKETTVVFFDSERKITNAVISCVHRVANEITILLSQNLSMSISNLIFSMPGMFSFGIIVKIGNPQLLVAAQNGNKEIRTMLAKELQTFIMPKGLRKCISDERVRMDFDKINMKEKFNDIALESSTKKSIAQSISQSLFTQIKKHVEFVVHELVKDL